MVSSERGFTYMALLMLLALFALASSLTLQVAEQSAHRTSEEELLAVGKAFRLAFTSYYMQSPVGTRHYPSTLDELVKDPRYPGIKRHLRRVYADPLTGKADWGLINAPEGGIMGIYSKAEGKPIHENRIIRLVPPALMTQAVTAASGALPALAPASGAHMLAASAPVDEMAQSYKDWQFGYAPNLFATGVRRTNSSP
jgi:type II secretory pathway pseudopilin PulG